MAHPAVHPALARVQTHLFLLDGAVVVVCGVATARAAVRQAEWCWSRVKAAAVNAADARRRVARAIRSTAVGGRGKFSRAKVAPDDVVGVEDIGLLTLAEVAGLVAAVVNRLQGDVEIVLEAHLVDGRHEGAAVPLLTDLRPTAAGRKQQPPPAVHFAFARSRPPPTGHRRRHVPDTLSMWPTYTYSTHTHTHTFALTGHLLHLLHPNNFCIHMATALYRMRLHAPMMDVAVSGG